MDLRVVAEELYVLPPSEFTATRDAEAAAARTGGDRAAAAAIKRLPRPTVGAWLANRFARDEPGRLDELLAVGDQMRAAQEQADGDALRRLTRRRSALLNDALQAARQAAESVGVAAGAAAVAELRGTLETAISDPTAAAAVRAGLLVRPIPPSGFGPPDLDGVLAVPLDAAQPVAPAKPRPKPKRAPATPKPDPGDARRSRELSQSRHRIATLKERAEGLQRQLDALDEHRRRVFGEIDEVHRALQRAQADHDKLEAGS